jgi:hypothetical protein
VTASARSGKRRFGELTLTYALVAALHAMSSWPPK